MKQKLKIAIFSGNIPSTTFVEHLIQGVAEKHEVFLFGTMSAKTQYASPNIKVYANSGSVFRDIVITFFRTLILLFKSPKNVFQLYKIISKYSSLYSQWNWYRKLLPIVLYRPDVLHVQWAKGIADFMPLQDVFNISIVLSLRGTHINQTPITAPNIARLYRAVFPKVKAFHAVSKAIGIEAQRYGAKANRITVIHSPIPQSAVLRYRPFEKKERPLKIVTIGRFHWIKGMRDMFNAISLLGDFSFQYSCVSSSPLSEAALFQLHQLELDDKITIIEGLKQDALFDFLQDCDVLVLPSLGEGIANVVLEAMAIGIPVISTDCGGMSEVVIPDETGWLVPIRNPEALVDAIYDCAQTPEIELQRITKNAHEFVKTHFNAEDSIGQFVELYEGVVGR
ncbi:glycosyltransferase family 4 protein [Lacinutrix undariae]